MTLGIDSGHTSTLWCVFGAVLLLPRPFITLVMRDGRAYLRIRKYECKSRTLVTQPQMAAHREFAFLTHVRGSLHVLPRNAGQALIISMQSELFSLFPATPSASSSPCC